MTGKMKRTFAAQRAAGRQLLDDWQASGLSMAAYARQHGIGAHRIKYWRTYYAEDKPASAFVPVVAVSSPQPQADASAARLTITCGAGVRIEVTTGCDVAWLASVVSALQC